MIPAPVRAIFFDAVGTLLHPDPPAIEVYAAAAYRFGSRLTSAEIGPRFRAAFAQEEAADRAANLRTSEERELRRWQTIVAHVLDDVTDPEDCFTTLFTHFADPAHWRSTPGTAKTLTTLAHRGYRLGMASNFDRRLRDIVAGHKEFWPLQFLVISSEVGWRKPALGFFNAVIHSVSLAPEQILLVGDDPINDEQGARQAGLRSLLFTNEDVSAFQNDRLGQLEDLLLR